MASPADTPNEYLIRVLALAHEEFDDAYDSLVADDEPGRKDIRDANPSRVISTLGRVASVASGLVFGKLHPRNPVWANADVDTRIDWWVDRVGTAAAALAAVPNAGGVVTSALDLDDLLGAAGQTAIINAVAREMGVTDRNEIVQTAAAVVLARRLTQTEIKSVLGDTRARAIAEPLPEPDVDPDKSMFAKLGSTARLIWRVATQVRALREDLHRRPHGGFLSRVVSKIPVVGAAGGFVGELTGVRRAATQARKSFAEHQRASRTKAALMPSVES